MAHPFLPFISVEAGDASSDVPASPPGPVRRELQLDSDVDNMSDSDYNSDLEKKTLRMGEPSPPSEVESVDGEPLSEQEGDSQRPGAWQSKAIVSFGEMDRGESTVVPIELLYEWYLDGKPPMKHTFTKRDLLRFGSSLVSQLSATSMHRYHDFSSDVRCRFFAGTAASTNI